jgi:hypothetical protein
MFEQSVEPIGVDNLDVVVQEQQEFTGRLSGGKIIEPRPVERFLG